MPGPDDLDLVSPEAGGVPGPDDPELVSPEAGGVPELPLDLESVSPRAGGVPVVVEVLGLSRSGPRPASPAGWCCVEVVGPLRPSSPGTGKEVPFPARLQGAWDPRPS